MKPKKTGRGKAQKQVRQRQKTQESVKTADSPMNPEARMTLFFRKINRKLQNNVLKTRPEPGPRFIKMVVHLIHHGNVPETASRALGVSRPQFRIWVEKGFDDITLDRKTSFARFVKACDMAMAQEEAKSISRITRGVRDWQAIAWTLERKAFQRWGLKQVSLQGSFEDMKRAGEDDASVLMPDVAGEIYAVLEEAGVMRIAGSPLEVEEIDVTGPPKAALEVEFESCSGSEGTQDQVK